MKFCIMCGGVYEKFKTPKHLLEINGEKIVERTIRLLKEAGAEKIYITSNDSRFDGFGVPRLEHHNSFRHDADGLKGYWLDAFYPFEQPVTYIFGDVYFTEDAIKTIVEHTEGNILFGSRLALNTLGLNWGEPFAYVVNDVKTFFEGIQAVKRLQDEGKTDRMPIVWELYRYLNGYDVNVHKVDKNFKVIDDMTNDIDSMDEYYKLKEAVE